MKKTTKRTFATLIILFILGVMPKYSNAAYWIDVSIDLVGSSTVPGCAYLTHDSTSPVFTNQWFKFLSTSQNQMLATALTALTLEKTLLVRVMDDGVTIDRMYIGKD